MGSQTRCWELTSPWQPRTRPSARALRLTGTRGLTFAKRRGRGLTHVLHRRGQGRLVYVVRPSWGCWGSLSSPHLPRPLHSPGSQCRCSHTAQGGEEPGRSLKTPQAKSRPRRHQPLVCSASASSPWLESVFSDFSGNAIWREGQSLRGCSGWGVPDTVGATELITAFRDHYVGPVSLQLLGTVLRQPTGGLVQTGPGLWPASERTCTGEELPRRNTQIHEKTRARATHRQDRTRTRVTRGSFVASKTSQNTELAWVYRILVALSQSPLWLDQV